MRVPRSVLRPRLHPVARTGAPVARSSEAIPHRDSRSPAFRRGLPSVRPFSRLRRDTMASADFSLPHHRQGRPFRRQARSPQVRPSAFGARPPGLRRLPLVAGASRSSARSPRKAPPRIRFLFVGPLLSLHASSRHPLTRMPLRFAQVGATSSLPDLHPVADAHAGRTQETGGACPRPHRRERQAWRSRRCLRDCFAPSYPAGRASQ